MKHQLILFVFCIYSFVYLAQSKKEVKKYKIKASSVTEIINGKPVYITKTLFDIETGQELQRTEYNNDQSIKIIHKYKYNLDGDEIEELECDALNKVTEKKVSKYNSFGQKTEELFYDGAGNNTKKVIRLLDKKGLLIEKKEFDVAGKIISLRKHSYEFK